TDDNLKHNAIMEIIIMKRIQGTQSNQYIITLTIKEYLDINSQLPEETIDQLLNLIYEYEETSLSKPNLVARLWEILGDAKESLINSDSDIVGQSRAISNLQTYVKGFDKICLILDRDYGSFKEYQYDKVLEICKDYKFSLGISRSEERR